MLVEHRDARADALLARFQLGRERIDHAKLLVIAGAFAGDLQNLAVHERRGRLGHLLRGVGRIAVLRRDRPQAVLLGHFELAERGRIFVEADDPQPLGLVRRLEILRQILADQRLRRPTRPTTAASPAPPQSANRPTATKVIVFAFSVIVHFTTGITESISKSM